ncbi:MAG: helix-turn-helix transcriptional regulator [Muribaculaceae bacterium]|nr:helix-turn-helix transcriptional regulator [Muribaculaceae bacterium]
MKEAKDKYKKMVAYVPDEIKAEINLSFAISDRIDSLMHEKGLSKKQLADAIGKRPSEITKWLSGEHNFTIATLSKLSTFFGQPIITVSC